MTDFTLRPAEIAGGTPLGTASVKPLVIPQKRDQPRKVLEQVIRAALERPPCVVSFSGGRDSSTVLAVAAHVARREGLPLPVPVTLRFPESQTADETRWQELVVRHLGLPDWARPEFGDELDIVGPVAAAAMRRHGLLWPFNAFFHVPIAEHAPGGSVLTGVGGDEVLGAGWQWLRANLILTGRAPLRARHLRPLGLALCPPPVRRIAVTRAMRRNAGSPVGWLRPWVRAEIDRNWVAFAADQPVRFDRCLEQVWWPLRARVMGQHALDAIAADVGAVCASPLTDSCFLGSLARYRGARMYRSRTGALRELVGDLLPASLLDRATKASFDDVFFHRWSAEFVAQWDGSGIDANYVDVDALRREWSKPPGQVDARSYTLLQSVWLAQQAVTP